VNELRLISIGSGPADKIPVKGVVEKGIQSLAFDDEI